MRMNKEYEPGLGMLRFTAMLCIVVCHVFQFFSNSLAFYFNVGVPVFLCLSGYLFGKREFQNIGKFLKNRLIRILVPYYLMLVLILAANAVTGTGVTAKELVSSLLCQQWYQYSVPQCGHLWYITCILGCYLITPALQWLCQQVERVSVFQYWVIFAVGAIGLLLIQFAGGMLTGTHFYIAYIFGYWYGAAVRTERKQPKQWLVNAAFVLALTGLVGLYMVERLGFTVPGIALEYYKVGFAAVSCLFFVYNGKWFTGRLWKGFLLFGDKFSYEVYLTHHVFILGSLSVLKLTQSLTVNVALAIVLTAVCAIVLHIVSEFITKRIRKER